MSALFSKKNKEGINLIIDLSSGSVGGALVDFSEEKPKIITNQRLYLPLNHSINREFWEKSIFEKLEELLENLTKEGANKFHLDQEKFGERKIKKTFCVVSAPWSSSSIEKFGKTEKEPFLVTLKSIQEMAEKQSRGESQENFMPIERRIVQVKLNGYLTENPLNKKTRKIELTAFEGRIDKKIIGNLERVISRKIQSEIIFHTHTLAVFSILEKIFPESKNYLISEITGEATELTLVEDGMIKKTISIPKGKNFFLRAVSEKFRVNPEVALSFLRLYYERKAEKNFFSAIDEIMGKNEKEWVTDLNNVLNEEKFSPTEIFLSVDPQFAGFFENYLKRDLKNLHQREIEPVYLGNKFLTKLVNFKNKTYDPFLSIASLSFKNII